MSRLRSALDSVSKAVGSTDLLARISRLRPGTSMSAAAAARSDGDPADCQASPPASAVAAAIPRTETKPDRRSVPVGEVPERPRMSPGAVAAGTSPDDGGGVARQLFRPAEPPANMEDACSVLAGRVNAYFGVEATEARGGTPATGHAPSPASPVVGAKAPPLPPPAEEVAPPMEAHSPVAPATGTTSDSPRRGLARYLPSPRPSVQALVGSYISPLVPRFRGVAAQQDKCLPPSATTTPARGDTGVVKEGEVVEKEVGEKADEKAKKQLQSQREKIIARVSVDNRTRALVKGLRRVTDTRLLTSRVEELRLHLLEFPETGGVAVKEGLLSCLLRLRQAGDPPLQAVAREALALVGYNDPVKGRGIRVLAIDGGGTRGLMALQTLNRLQKMTGKPIHQLFDYICGVSTGAILAFMLSVFQIPLDECEQMYRKLGSDVFKQNVIVGTVKMGWSHAFYDSEIWENILKERMGEGLMFESARDPNCPKVSAVSTIVNRGLPLKAYVFRNYRLSPGVRSHYLGDCKHKMWQAIRASSAAPGYFQEFVLGKDLHQDGGLLINNPTALAIHECRCLWPGTPLQCVVSLGTGRYESAGTHSATSTSLKTKLTNVISSATDTEEVHTMLDALLPPDTYFRFNPYLSEDVALDESRPERLNFLKGEGERYLDRNQAKLAKAAHALAQEKSAIQRLAEWARLKADMYEGPPFLSKL